jgi:hypothetical protein
VALVFAHDKSQAETIGMEHKRKIAGLLREVETYLRKSGDPGGR